MYMEDDRIAPRAREGEDMLSRMLREDQGGLGREGVRQGQPLRCDGTRESWGLQEYPLASVYAPMQAWRNLYDHETALLRGTLFEDLDLPFVCGGMTGGEHYD